MAKYITLDENSDPTDGLFEVIIWRHGSKRQLLKIIARSIIGKPKAPVKTKEVLFETTSALAMQLDGEIITIDPATKVAITIESKKIATFL